MTEITFGKIVETGKPAKLDVDRLIETRMLIQASSGGGKSYAIRKFMEMAYGLVQIILIDIEGEFATLREKYDFVLFGEGGDFPVSVKTAEVLARRLLELEVSTIINLYELDPPERKQFVKLFLDAMINAPKELWHPCIVVVDEANELAPERGFGEAVSTESVSRLMTRGRKRGYAAVLATQRISSLHKEAAAQARNKLIGVCTLDDDMKRGAFELGFGKEKMYELRNLEAGEFFAFGPALSKEVQKVKVGEVETTHYQAGRSKLTAPPRPTAKVKAILSKLEDLPQVAEKEADERKALVAENSRLRAELGQARRELTLGSRGPSPEEVKRIQAEAFDRGASMADKRIGDIAVRFDAYQTSVARMFTDAQAQAGTVEGALAKIRDLRLPDTTWAKGAFDKVPRPRPEAAMPVAAKKPDVALTHPTASNLDEFNEVPLNGGQMRILGVAAQLNPGPATIGRIAALAKYSTKGGTFQQNFKDLVRRGMIEKQDGDTYLITGAGLANAGPYEPLPTDPGALVDAWASKFGPGGKLLKAIASRRGEWVPLETVAAEVKMTHTGGAFGQYIGDFRRAGLVEKQKVEGVEQVRTMEVLNG